MTKDMDEQQRLLGLKMPKPDYLALSKSLLGSAKWSRPRLRLVVDRGKEVETKDEGKDDGVRVGPLQVDD